MTLIELKKMIESGITPDSLIIFECDDEDFIPKQYIKAWANLNNVQTHIIESLDDFPVNTGSFLEIPDNDYYILAIDELEDLDDSWLDESRLFIVTSKIDKKLKERISKNITKVPKLEEWQIQSYMEINYTGLEKSQLEYIVKNCNGSIYKAILDGDKLNIFPPGTRKLLFDQFKEDDIFSSLSTSTTFDLIIAIQNKDIEKVRNILLDEPELNSIGVLTLLYSAFRKLAMVWMNKNPTPETTGLKSNQIYAINKSPRVYSKEQLISILNLLTIADTKMKLGEIPEPILLDYVLVNVLGS